jgi:hypothetical protein
MNTDIDVKKEEAVKPVTEKVKNKGGRPTKAAIASKKRGGRGKGAVGRPKGDAAVMNEYKARMLNSPKSPAVLKTLFDVATDPEHKHYAAATKMIMDRLAPTIAFEKEIVKDAGGKSININITGLSSSVSSAETVDAEFEELE